MEELNAGAVENPLVMVLRSFIFLILVSWNQTGKKFLEMIDFELYGWTTLQKNLSFEQ